MHESKSFFVSPRLRYLCFARSSFRSQDETIHKQSYRAGRTARTLRSPLDRKVWRLANNNEAKVTTGALRRLPLPLENNKPSCKPNTSRSSIIGVGVGSAYKNVNFQPGTIVLRIRSEHAFPSRSRLFLCFQQRSRMRLLVHFRFSRLRFRWSISRHDVPYPDTYRN